MYLISDKYSEFPHHSRIFLSVKISVLSLRFMAFVVTNGWNARKTRLSSPFSVSRWNERCNESRLTWERWSFPARRKEIGINSSDTIASSSCSTFDGFVRVTAARVSGSHIFSLEVKNEEFTLFDETRDKDRIGICTRDRPVVDLSTDYASLRPLFLESNSNKMNISMDISMITHPIYSYFIWKNCILVSRYIIYRMINNYIICNVLFTHTHIKYFNMIIYKILTSHTGMWFFIRFMVEIKV